MARHRFAVGQSVTLAFSKHHRPAEGAFRVVAALPDIGGAAQYRIKGDLEKFERVVAESHLSAA